MLDAARTAGADRRRAARRPGRSPSSRSRCRTSIPSRESSLAAAGRGQGRAAAPRRPRGARVRPAHRPGRGVAVRGVARGAGGDVGRAHGPRPPADDALRRARRRRGGRQAAGRALGRRGAAAGWSSSLVRGRARRSTGARRRGWRSRCSTRSRRRPGRWRWCWAPGESGILLHEAVGHGLEADFNRKQTSNYTDQVGKQVASTLCTVVDDGTIVNARGSINVDDEGYRRAAQRADRERDAGRLHARPDLGQALRHRRRPGTGGARASATSRCRA